MEDINWGVPSVTATVVRKKKQERFDTPVLSMRAITAPGLNRMMSFNKAAETSLGLVKDSILKIGFKGESIFLMSTGVQELAEGEKAPKLDAGSFVLNGNLSFSDKKVFNHIATLLKLDINLANHLTLEAIENKPFMQVTGVVTDPSEVESNVIEEVIEEAIDDVIESPFVTEKPQPQDKVIVKETKTIKVVEKKEIQLAPERVAFAIDDTDEEEVIEPETKDEDEEDEW